MLRILSSGKRGTRLRDITYMPVVKFFECLEFERMFLFFKAPCSWWAR